MTHVHERHHHEHRHASRRRLAIAFGITFCIVLAQLIGSALTGSLALLTDTAHAAVDASNLLFALFAASFALRPASDRKTWGYARVEVLAALAQSLLLICVGVYAAIEGIERFSAPPHVHSGGLLVFGIVGLCANAASMLVLMGEKESNLNLKAAFLHVLNDALGSVGVIVAAVVIRFTGFYQADAIAGLFIACLIVPRAFVLLYETVQILLESTPKEVDLEEVRRHLMNVHHVKDVHDLHASKIGSDLPILSVHVVLEKHCFESAHALQILRDVQDCLSTHFPVSFLHSTIQLEDAELHAREKKEVIHG